MTAAHLHFLDAADPDRELDPFERNYQAEVLHLQHLEDVLERLRSWPVAERSITEDEEHDPQTVAALLAPVGTRIPRGLPSFLAQEPTPADVQEAKRQAAAQVIRSRQWLDAYRLARLGTIDPTAPAPGALMDPARRRDQLARVARRLEEVQE